MIRGGPADPCIVRPSFDHPGFGIRDILRHRRGEDRRSGAGVVVELVFQRAALPGIAVEGHAGGGSRERQPMAGSRCGKAEPGGERLASGGGRDGFADRPVIGGSIGLRPIGQIPHRAVEAVHHRHPDRCSGRQPGGGEQHIILVVPDVGPHAAQRTGDVVQADRRLVAVAYRQTVRRQGHAAPRRKNDGDNGGDDRGCVRSRPDEAPAPRQPDDQNERARYAGCGSPEPAGCAQQRARGCEDGQRQRAERIGPSPWCRSQRACRI